MRTTQQLSITLPNEMADVVKMKVRIGEYATESEFIRDGLRALLAHDRAVVSSSRTRPSNSLQAYRYLAEAGSPVISNGILSQLTGSRTFAG